MRKGLLIKMAALMACAYESPFETKTEVKEYSSHNEAMNDPALKESLAIQRKQKQGLKSFQMEDGTIIWALNRKNAERKFKRQFRKR